MGGIDNIISRLSRIPPRRAPEWGSGGIYGLKFHRDILYFTVAFEAEARFYGEHGLRTYRFEKVGYLPVSGGDTYNAVDAVDDEIFFGGWVHAPAVFGGRRGRGGFVLFYNKYSHVHSYSVADDEVRLLWKEGVGERDVWAGEVTDIIYDPVNDRLLLARGDGHLRLGVYSLPRRGGAAAQLSPRRALKGALHYDHACFDSMKAWRDGVREVQCLDLVEGRWLRVGVDYEGHSVDGAPHSSTPLSGCAASAYGRYLHFIRGGFIAGNPVAGEPMWYYRLMDFGPSGYGPLRTNTVTLGGGVLVAYNSYSHGLLYPRNKAEEEMARERNTTVAPSVLLYIAPPQVKVVAALGARITSIESAGRWILLGTSTTANYEALDAAPVEAGWRDVLPLPSDIIQRAPPPLYASAPGWMVSGRWWGGIPLTGYREARLTLYTRRGGTLELRSYDASMPPVGYDADRVSLSPGRESIDLSGYGPMVSLKFLDEGLEKASVRLEP